MHLSLRPTLWFYGCCRIWFYACFNNKAPGNWGFIIRKERGRGVGAPRLAECNPQRESIALLLPALFVSLEHV
nr:MAG TPA: hypothetical protein [Caudoviricetes sp.]